MMGSNGASGLKRTSLSRYKNYLRKHVGFLDIHPQWITIYLGKGVCVCLGHDGQVCFYAWSYHSYW